MRYVVAALMLTLSVPVYGQIISRPTEPPIVTAENERWYRLGEPLVFAGDFYYPAGPVAFFDGNVMVRTAHYNGVPLYADTTLEPYSIVFVPVGRGLMQPYERRRVGELAGTSGSRLSSFPGASQPSARDIPMAAGPPTGPPQSSGAINVFPPEPGAVGTVGTPAPPPAATVVRAPIRTSRPVRRENVWVDFQEQKWVNAGSAASVHGRVLVRVGDLSGHAVYRAPGGAQDVIYVETVPGVVVPFRLEH